MLHLDTTVSFFDAFDKAQRVLRRGSLLIIVEADQHVALLPPPRGAIRHKSIPTFDSTDAPGLPARPVPRDVKRPTGESVSTDSRRRRGSAGLPN